jgi:hypothetical protein
MPAVDGDSKWKERTWMLTKFPNLHFNGVDVRGTDEGARLPEVIFLICISVF